MGLAIRARLDELQKTQGWLAEELGVSNNAVSKWISTGKISRENSVAAARALEISVEELLGDSPRPAKRQEVESGEEMLRRAAEMLEVYRLASPNDRRRIDLVFREVSSHIATMDQAKSSGRG